MSIAPDSPDAACRDSDVSLFFPHRDDGPEYRHARRICGGCPIRAACLAETMRVERGKSAGYRHGMFGGLTPRERGRLARTGNMPRPALTV